MMKKFLFFLTAFAAYGLIGASHATSPEQQLGPAAVSPAIVPSSQPLVVTPDQARATEGVSRELMGKTGRVARALGAFEDHTLEISAVSLAGCAFGGLGCVYGMTGVLAVVGGHALFGAGKYLDCEVRCTQGKGAAGGEAFSRLLTSQFPENRDKNQDNTALKILMKFIMTDKGADATAVREAVKCLKGCGTFATKNFTFAFMSNLEDVNNYGISIIAAFLLDTVISWGVRMPKGNPRKSKLVKFTKIASTNTDPTTKEPAYHYDACSYLNSDQDKSERCKRNFIYLYKTADQVLNPAKFAAAAQIAQVK